MKAQWSRNKTFCTKSVVGVWRRVWIRILLFFVVFFVHILDVLFVFSGGTITGSDSQQWRRRRDGLG